MKRMFLIGAIFAAGCIDGTVIKQHEDCSQAAVDAITPPDDGDFKAWVSWGKDFGKNVGDAPSNILHCWDQPRWQVPSAEPSTDPVIVEREDLPLDAKEAAWLDNYMPGYIVYYEEKDDGSGYNYYAVKNDPFYLE